MQPQKHRSLSQHQTHQSRLRINIGLAMLSTMLILAIFGRWSFEWEYWLSVFLLTLLGPLLDVRWSFHASLPKEVERAKE